MGPVVIAGAAIGFAVGWRAARCAVRARRAPPDDDSGGARAGAASPSSHRSKSSEPACASSSTIAGRGRTRCSSRWSPGRLPLRCRTSLRRSSSPNVIEGATVGEGAGREGAAEVVGAGPVAMVKGEPRSGGMVSGGARGGVAGGRRPVGRVEPRRPARAGRLAPLHAQRHRLRPPTAARCWRRSAIASACARPRTAAARRASAAAARCGSTASRGLPVSPRLHGWRGVRSPPWRADARGSGVRRRRPASAGSARPAS